MGSRGKTGVEGVHIVRTQRGNDPLRWYIYAWRGGPRIRTVIGGCKPSLNIDDVRAIAKAVEDSSPANKDDIRGLVASYRSPKTNPDWATLSPRTQELWGNCLDAIIIRWGDVPLRLWNDQRMVKKVMEWRSSMADTPRKADEHISNLHRLLKFGKLHARVNINVAADIPKLYKGGEREEIVWTEAELARFYEHGKQPINDAVRLAAMTGLRRQDLVALTWDNIGEFAVNLTALKKSRGKRRKVIMPIVPGLQSLLDELRTRKRRDGVNTVLVNMHGKSWTGDSIATSFYDARAKAQITYIDNDGETKWKRLHDLRGTFATRLMTIPGERLTDTEIADLMGWSVKQVAEIRRRYVDDAAIVVAMGKRLANTLVKQSVKQQGDN